MSKKNPHQAGYDAKMEEIDEMGWTAARDKFNMENPPGQKWSGSPDAFAYTQGEYKALCDRMQLN